MAAYVTYGRVQRCAPRGGRWALMGLAAVTLLGLAACGRVGLGASDEMSWARAALERNDRIEVVATDPATSTFTIRIKDTGDLRTVRADQIIAAPPGVAESAGTAPGASSGTPAASAESATASNSAASEEPAQSATAEPAAPAASAPSTASNNAPPGAMTRSAPSAVSGGSAAPSNTMTRQTDASASIPRTGYQPANAPASEVPNPNSDVTSITPGGKVLESGPGYAIKMASAKNGPQATARVERTSTTSAVERRHDPIICQGARLLQIDNRNLEFDGDAVSAQDGCEIHITNSHIIAKGVGVSARAANVHIDNSQIEGDTASIDASQGAQVYAASSTFKGVSRREDHSSFHDLGGNVWN
jgi:hypothetical protein